FPTALFEQIPRWFAVRSLKQFNEVVRPVVLLFFKRLCHLAAFPPAPEFGEDLDMSIALDLFELFDCKTQLPKCSESGDGEACRDESKSRRRAEEPPDRCVRDIRKERRHPRHPRAAPPRCQTSGSFDTSRRWTVYLQQNATGPVSPDPCVMHLLLKKNLAELVLLARLEDREHLVTRLELGRADGDLRLAVSHHRDQPRTLRKAQLLDGLAGARRALVDLHFDDLEVLLAQLEQMDEFVLRHLVLDEPEDARRRADRGRDAEQVEVRLVARIVHARDHLRHAV